VRGHQNGRGESALANTQGEFRNEKLGEPLREEAVNRGIGVNTLAKQLGIFSASLPPSTRDEKVGNLVLLGRGSQLVRGIP
jgi:hypothetical protein